MDNQISQIDYKINSIDLDSLIEYLLSRDFDFIPPLSARLDISEFAEKLYRFATIYSAHAARIIGISAIYANNFETYEAYITNISIHPEYYGTGLAKNFMNFCLNDLKEKKFKSVKLEVNRENVRAITFYRKFDFSIVGESNRNGYYMRSTIMQSDDCLL